MSQTKKLFIIDNRNKTRLTVQRKNGKRTVSSQAVYLQIDNEQPTEVPRDKYHLIDQLLKKE